jgi:phage shock protein A
LDFTPVGFVQFEDGLIRITATNLAELKIALKELKLMKKQFTLNKREVSARQTQLRAAYTEEVRTQGSKMRGGGNLGRFVRSAQTISRDAKRAQLAKDLAPHEREKQQIERVTAGIDSMILRVEAEILNLGP